MTVFKQLFLVFMISNYSIANAETVEANLLSPIQSVEVNGTIDVELNNNAKTDHFRATYEGEKRSNVTVENKNGILHVQTNGVFHNKPHLKIDLSNEPLAYSANGVGESVLSINSERAFNVNLSGVNKAKVIGQSRKIVFKLSGTSSIDLTDYSAKEFEGYLDGVSSVYIKENAPLTIQKNGIGKVYYK